MASVPVLRHNNIRKMFEIKYTMKPNGEYFVFDAIRSDPTMPIVEPLHSNIVLNRYCSLDDVRDKLATYSAWIELVKLFDEGAAILDIS